MSIDYNSMSDEELLALAGGQESSPPSIDYNSMSDQELLALAGGQEQPNLTESSIKEDPEWIQLSKTLYEMNEGPDAAPLDNDSQAAKYGLNYMGWFNYNLPKMGLEATQLRGATDEQRKSFVRAMDMYDEKEASFSGLVRAARGVLSDPSTYVGIGTFGASTAGAQALKQGIKEGVKQSTKAGLAQGAKIGAIEGAAYSAVDNSLRQSARIQAGEQEGFDIGQSALSAGIGAVAGGALGGTVGALGGRSSGKIAEASRVREEEAAAARVLREQGDDVDADSALTNPITDVMPNLKIDEAVVESATQKLAQTEEEVTPRLSLNVSNAAAEAAESFLVEAGVPLAANMRITDQVADLLSVAHKNPQIMEAIQSTLVKFNLSEKEFGQLFASNVSDSARVLQRMSQIKSNLAEVGRVMRGEVPEEPMAISIISRIGKGARDLDNVRRGLLVSQLATTARNFTAQVGRVGVDSLTEGVDNALNLTFNPVRRLFGKEEKVVDHTNTFRLFANLTTNKKYAKDITDAMMELYKGEEDRLFSHYVSDVAEATNNQTFKQAAKATDFLNTVNRMQEYFYRRGMFASSLEKQLSKRNISLRELYDSGRMNEINITDVEKAVDDALEFTYAKTPDGELGKSAVNLMNSVPFVTTAFFPFARFMANAMEFQFKHSPLGPLSLMSKKERDALASGDTKVFSKAMVGSAALLAMIEAKRQGFSDDSRWYEIQNENGESYDMRPYFPLTPYMLVADIVVRAERNLKAPSSKDIIQGLSGAQFRAGAGLSFIDNFIKDISNIKAEDKITNAVTDFTSDVLGGFLTPLRMFGDFIDSLPSELGGIDKQTFKAPVPEGKPDIGYVDISDIGQNLQKSIPVLNRSLPDLTAPTRVEPRGRPEKMFGLPAPLVRQLSGVTLSEPRNPAEQELERLGFKMANIRGYSGNKKADIMMNQNMAPYVEQYLSPMVESESYQSLSNALKAKQMTTWLSDIRAAAKKTAISQDPVMFYKTIKGRMSDTDKRALKEVNPEYYKFLFDTE
jgi:hypothetical protein